MNIGSLVRGRFIEGSLSRAEAAIVRAKSLGLTAWAILNYNLVEGILLPKRYLAICLERGGVSVACGERFLNRNYLMGSKRYTFEDGGYVTPAGLAATARLAMEELHCRGSGVLLGLPREWFVVRTAELPSVVKENLKNVVAYEIDRLTPLNADDATYDYLMGAEKDGKLTLSLMAMKKGLLEPYVAALNEMKSSPVRISTPLMGMERLSSVLVGNDTYMLLHVGTHAFEGGSVEKGNIANTFYGSFDAADDGGIEDGRRSEILSVLEQQNSTAKPSLVCLLSEKDGVEVPETLMGTVVRELKAGDMASLFRSKQENLPWAPTCILYEALSNGAQNFNLAPGTEKRRSPFITTLLLVALLVAMMVPYVVVPLEMEKRKISEIEHQITARKKDVRAVEAMKKDIDLIRSEIDEIDRFKRSRPMALNVLKELTTLLPKTVWLTRTRVTEQTVEIEGYASSATSLLSLLEESNLFRKVEFASPTVKDTRLNSDRFVIRMEIEGFEKQPDVKERTQRKDGAKK